MSLTAAERETSIVMDDAGDFAIVTTWQRPMITKLNRNAGAEKLEDLKCDGSKGAIFRVPAKLVSIRNPRAKKEMTDKQKADLKARGERLAASRKRGGYTGGLPKSEVKPPAQRKKR